MEKVGLNSVISERPIQLVVLFGVVGFACFVGYLQTHASEQPSKTAKPGSARSFDVELTSSKQVMAALEHATDCERAIVFFHFDWSIHASQPELFSELTKEYCSNQHNPYVAVHYVDCTDVHLHRLNKRLQKLFPNIKNSISGGGEVMWIAKNQLRDVQYLLEMKEENSFDQLTARAFQ